MPHLHYAPIWRRTGWDRREGPFSEHDLKRLPVVVWVPGTDIAAPLASTPGPLADEPSVPLILDASRVRTRRRTNNERSRLECC
jgi:hypothetical protein